ncbi:hypothetical protein H7U19_06895 [Hyunsoonleella sp. SJ7]|uniref:Uncharacterized protein n=1 Tax=Hyunsoonleella aquatilis TaxID=2762758 RepID=A0A923KI93_9FLAO|nr:hypothetical protein [Hyunsoonleella aquatilis]MBC3758124.1 hypothetical protein [Hyunsoonleella aquatilis]
MQLPNTFDGLIERASHLDLYKKLIRQLNKDFLLANLELDLHEEVLPSSLKLVLQDTVFQLINQKFTEYLNLLYIVDVPEKEVKQLDGFDVVKLSEEVTFLILKRELQKVIFKAKYS